VQHLVYELVESHFCERMNNHPGLMEPPVDYSDVLSADAGSTSGDSSVSSLRSFEVCGWP
jgi:hypothetical protein